MMLQWQQMKTWSFVEQDMEKLVDVRNAFLNGPLKEGLYLRPLTGKDGVDCGAGKVMRQHCALHGSHQASRTSNTRLEAELTRKGKVHSDEDPALWTLHGKRGAVLAMFYVDNGLVATKKAKHDNALEELVASVFLLRACGEPYYFPGIQLSKEGVARTISIIQDHKALELAAALGLGEARKAAPMSCKAYSGLLADQKSESMVDNLEYEHVVARLSSGQCTHPEIALAVGSLAAFCTAPREEHHKASLVVVRYVGSTDKRGVTIRGRERALGVGCDAIFAACQDLRRSKHG
jgi:hypothetical protein